MSPQILAPIVTVFIALLAVVLFLFGLLLAAWFVRAFADAIAALHQARAFGVSADNQVRTAEIVTAAQDEIEEAKAPRFAPQIASEDDIMAQIMAERRSRNGTADTFANEGGTPDAEQWGAGGTGGEYNLG